MENEKVKNIIVSFIISNISKAVLVLIMYDCIKGIYISNEYLAIVLTIISLWIIKDLKIEVECR